MNNKKNPNNIIIHNQLNEGLIELIVREAMKTINKDVKFSERYAKQVQIMKKILNKNDLANTITTYFTKPYQLTKALENKKIDDIDMLHYISDNINSSNIINTINQLKYNDDENMKLGVLSKIVSKIKGFFLQKNTKELTERTKTIKENSRNNLIKSITVSSDKLIINSSEEKIKEGVKRYIPNKKSNSKNDGPSLND